MDPLRQLNDDGAVIGYRPDLRYITDKSNGQLAEQEAANADQARISYHTRCLVSFINNPPSKAASAIMEVTTNLENFIDRLASSFKCGEWSDYNNISSLVAALRSGDKEYAEKFVEYHRKNMKTNNVVPEVMLELNRVEERMNNILGLFETLYYGQDGMTKEDMQKFDTDAILKLANLEDEKNFKNVNYVALANDASFDRLTYEYAIHCNTNCRTLADMAMEDLESESNASVNRLDVIKKLVFEADDEVLYMDDSFNRYNSTSMMSNALYNYYNTRSDLIDLYEIENKTHSETIASRIYSAQCEMDEALKDVCRAYMGCWNHVDGIYNYLKEKRDLKNLYSTLFQE